MTRIFVLMKIIKQFMFGEKNGRNYQHSRNSSAGQALTIPAALPVTVPYPAPCGAAAPAVPVARCCKRSYGFARLLSLPLSMQDTAG